MEHRLVERVELLHRVDNHFDAVENWNSQAGDALGPVAKKSLNLVCLGLLIVLELRFCHKSDQIFNFMASILAHQNSSTVHLNSPSPVFTRGQCFSRCVLPEATFVAIMSSVSFAVGIGSAKIPTQQWAHFFLSLKVMWIDFEFAGVVKNQRKKKDKARQTTRMFVRLQFIYVKDSDYIYFIMEML